MSDVSRYRALGQLMGRPSGVARAAAVAVAAAADPGCRGRPDGQV